MKNGVLFLIILTIGWSFDSCATAELPNILIIGDSISMGGEYPPGYTKPLAGILKKKLKTAYLYHPGHSGDSAYALTHLDSWLGTTKWDVIHFNLGLHDLKHVDENGKPATCKEKGHNLHSLAEYEKNMEAIVLRLKKSGAKLIFATTTPFPDQPEGPCRRASEVKKYNAAALKVMRKYGVEVNDLYAFALPRLNQLQRPNNVHFTSRGSEALAEQVAKHILKAVNSDPE